MLAARIARPLCRLPAGLAGPAAGLGRTLPVAVAAPLARALSTPTYSERMQAKGRPVSPHLTIYKFPVAAISSIATRITGCVLTVGTSGIGVLALTGIDMPSAVDAFQAAAPVLVPVAKFAVAFPLTYHWASALRHTYWDVTCQGLHIDTVKQSSFALLGGAGALSAMLAFVSI